MQIQSCSSGSPPWPPSRWKGIEVVVWNPEPLIRQIKLRLKCGPTLLLLWLQPWADHCRKEVHCSGFGEAPCTILGVLIFSLKVAEAITKICKAHLLITYLLYVRLCAYSYNISIKTDSVISVSHRRKSKAWGDWIACLRSHCWKEVELGQGPGSWAGECVLLLLRSSASLCPETPL